MKDMMYSYDFPVTDLMIAASDDQSPVNQVLDPTLITALLTQKCVRIISLLIVETSR